MYAVGRYQYHGFEPKNSVLACAEKERGDVLKTGINGKNPTISSKSVFHHV